MSCINCVKLSINSLKHLFLLLIFTIQFSSLNTFNFNVNSRVTFEAITPNQDSYFGYSVLMRKGPTSKIIVGAPKDRNIATQSVQNPGMIYTCDVPHVATKTQVVCDPEYIDRKGNDRDMFGTYHHKKDNMWLGMTLAGTDFTNGTVVMCAPRWTNQVHRDFYLANGLCYSLPSSEDKNYVRLKELMPLIDRNSQGFQAHFLAPSAYFYAYGEAGMAVKLTEDGKDLILGAPGIYSWTGSVIRYRIGKQGENNDYFAKKNIPNPFYTPELNESSYFGYSVESGKFLQDKDLLYVAGAPRGADYKGQVFLFEFPDRDSARLRIYGILIGDQMGEYFGSSLLAVDIDQDGLDDLIVGAPLYTQKYFADQGRVHVYMNSEKLDLQRQTSLIAGDLALGARFGSALAKIGDINSDGYTDVAIGAPYEDEGRGAVYIYFGSANGLNPTYAQKIAVAGTRGFGISISKGLDVDNNKNNDIAVGAHESSNVLLFYGHPHVHLDIEMTALPMEISIDSTNFTVQFCLQFVSGTTEANTAIVVNLKLDEDHGRARLENPENAKFPIIGQIGNKYCKDIAMLINMEMHDYSRPINIRADIDLQKNPQNDTTFCKTCAVLHPKTVKTGELRVPFASGCGDDNVCQPSLKLTVDLPNELPYVIGSSGSITLNITITNTGEPAYVPKIELTPPANVPLLRVPPKCHLVDTLFWCDLDNPLRPGSQDFVTIELDTNGLKSNDRVIGFEITASSGGEEVTPEDNVQQINITLKPEANINITGEALADLYVSMKPNPNVTNITISHTYEVQNLGPTSLEAFEMFFLLPIEYKDQEEETTKTYSIVNVMQPVDTVNQAPFICRAVNGEFYTPPNEGHGVTLSDDEETIGSESITTGVLTADTDSIATTVEPNKDETRRDGFDSLSIEDFSPLSKVQDDEFLKIASLHINCTDTSKVTCLLVQCLKTGGLPVNSNDAHMILKMMLNQTNIEHLLKKSPTVTLTTYSAAQTTSGSIVFGYARSLLIGGPRPPSTTPLWIVIVAIVCGVLLLALISFGLYKCDFFKRNKRDELELLKNRELSMGEINDAQEIESD